jgi:hypothetical protein
MFKLLSRAYADVHPMMMDRSENRCGGNFLQRGSIINGADWYSFTGGAASRGGQEGADSSVTSPETSVWEVESPAVGSLRGWAESGLSLSLSLWKGGVQKSWPCDLLLLALLMRTCHDSTRDQPILPLRI